jgi:hypothetical protein
MGGRWGYYRGCKGERLLESDTAARIGRDHEISATEIDAEKAVEASVSREKQLRVQLFAAAGQGGHSPVLFSLQENRS